MKKSVFNWLNLHTGYRPLPCQEIPDIPFKYTRSVNDKTGKFKVVVSYPKKIKIIKQIRSVDVHTLVGNIGGYIGLFLGKSYICLYLNPVKTLFSRKFL